MNNILRTLAIGIRGILADNLVGVYLAGSLSYGDFSPGRSDIDLITLLTKPASPTEIAALNALHEQTRHEHAYWGRHVECSYVPIEMLASTLPPRNPRPYHGEDVLYPAAPYGNEWIINNYLLREHGIALYGPDPRALIPEIDIQHVQAACIRDLFTEWEPKITDPTWLDNSHYQSYLVLNLCRILYTVLTGATGTKSIAALWVRDQYGEWNTLIDAAQDWRHGEEMTRQGETAGFIAFAIDRVKATPLFARIRVAPPNDHSIGR